MKNIFEEANKTHWNELAPVHARSYDTETLKKGRHLLDEIQLREMGNVDKKTLLHLQCHIGTDSLSWVRRGAIVTGVDFSGRSIEYANILKEEVGLEADFIHSNIYDLEENLSKQFDVVYTSKGVLVWLKDLGK